MSMLSQGCDRPPKTNKVRLYGTRFDAYCVGLRLTLVAKGIDFEFALLDMINKPDWYKDVNPVGRIPCVECGDEAVGETLVIYDYLENKFSEKPMRSTDPYKRAKDAEVMLRFAEHLAPHIYGMVRAPKDHIDSVKSGLEKVDKVLALRATDYFGGSSPNIIDFYIWGWVGLLPPLHKVHKLEMDCSENDHNKHYLAWLSRMKEHPLVQAERKYVKVDLDIQTQFIQSAIDGKANHLIGY